MTGQQINAANISETQLNGTSDSQLKDGEASMSQMMPLITAQHHSDNPLSPSQIAVGNGKTGAKMG